MKNHLLLLGALLGLPGLASAAVYTGTWHNTTFGSSGGVLFDIALSPPDIVVSADFDGGVFGFGDPPVLILPGMFDSGGSATVSTTEDPFFGDVTGTFSPLGMVTMDITDLPITGPTPTGFGIFSTALEGTFDGASIALEYLVIFNCGGGTPTACPGPDLGTEGFDYARGTISAALVPLPGALLLLASAVAGLFGINRTRSARDGTVQS